MQRKLQDDLDEVNNKWRSVKENFEKFEDDTKERLEDEKRKVRGEITKPLLPMLSGPSVLQE